ncbi:MAG: homoserine dehydrogenase [Deltaproteobacteria bacterium RIFCSPLOWO2_02_FULL_50_16]|nr:MAG: homoserine dehydrogenase [Deltaproteobacteria bacterium GWA2_50_8]OGQ25617.1 MAG: homoserine dehydrogenase [Deltaproteobacteria bacterium RIFCSPHIGHO2_02_FULL_50_15]OGQ55851.1 MAG: homoserine dehydrogenase [Deltaproteobacteria bacterium RIFCSPLOWO2_02_FULL_50_16]OGQ67956.1 MAG: homoserine dehydrogenase [Deltaproteobacteria bacterium RIFCSPLOWO2_12_FULL_50_11]
MTKKIQVGLIGCGTVGTGVAKLLLDHQSLIERRTGVKFQLKKIADLYPKKNRPFKLPSALFTKDAENILNDPDISVVVELIGGIEPAKTFLLKALDRGKHVVTANKALLADHGIEIFQKALQKGLQVGFEASVAGGIPIIRAISEGFVANHISQVYGIINGTCNYILSEMTAHGSPYDTVLKKAQKAGYAEANPALDVGGIDAAHKLTLIAMLCYGAGVTTKKIFVEGIERISPIDIEFAKKIGFTIKLLAISKEQGGTIELRVHPTMIPSTHQLATVSGPFNAIYLKGDAVGETLFYGRGAGMMPTASAVVSDVVAVSRAHDERGIIGIHEFEDMELRPMDKIESEYYLRVEVVDKPKVLSQITGILGQHDISIASVYQPQQDHGAKVPIIILTHRGQEKNVQKAILKIDELPFVVDKTVIIRVEHFRKKEGKEKG